MRMIISELPPVPVWLKHFTVAGILRQSAFTLSRVQLLAVGGIAAPKSMSVPLEENTCR